MFVQNYFTVMMHLIIAHEQRAKIIMLVKYNEMTVHTTCIVIDVCTTILKTSCYSVYDMVREGIEKTSSHVYKCGI